MSCRSPDIRHYRVAGRRPSFIPMRNQVETEVETMATKRQIGPVGTVARVASGLGLLYIAGDGSLAPWGIEWQDAFIGFVGLAGLLVAAGVAARGHGPWGLP